ncbi:hypothetical protein FACS189413_09470 [Bacteroidia bacterium]|nr:hypothetical protein FACS189413_09470 [Bacteroidia bacterium]
MHNPIIYWLLFFFGLLLAWLSEEKQTLGLENLQHREYVLPDFNVIVADKVRIFVMENEQNSLVIYFPKGQTVPSKFYRMKNDTLYLSGTTAKMTIYCKRVPSVIVKNRSGVKFEGFPRDSLLLRDNLLRYE